MKCLYLYRRAFKATFIMMPLFGVQLIFIIYRPPFHLAISEAYEIIAAIIIHSQVSITDGGPGINELFRCLF